MQYLTNLFCFGVFSLSPNPDLVGGLGGGALPALLTPLLLTPSLIISATRLASSLGLVVRGVNTSSSSSPSSPSTLVDTMFLGTCPSASSFLASQANFFFMAFSKSSSLELAYCLQEEDENGNE